jgi:hypothetical protein
VLLAPVAAAQYGAPRVLARVDIPNLDESSGLAASRTHPGVFWTHNDSGGGPWIYAFDRTGKSLGRWSVPRARANDWEDMSMGPGPAKSASYLYIGDIGDNEWERKFVTIYRVPEPALLEGGTHRTEPAEPFRLEYPDGPHDCEALLVHPKSGDVYLVIKARGRDKDTAVYKAAAPLTPGAKIRLRRIAVLELPVVSVFSLLIGGVTGGGIAPDGTRVALCGYLTAWEAELPPGARDFDAIWTAKWREIGLGRRPQGEAVAYRHDGKALLATSEGRPFPLIEVERRID